MTTVDIPLSKLEVDKFNCRKDGNNSSEGITNSVTSTDQTSIAELAADMKNGLINPIVVRKDPKEDKYYIVAGQRRFLAAKYNKWETIACSVRKLNDDQAELLSAAENLQRNQLTVTERMRIYSQLNVKYSMVERIAKLVSLKTDTIRTYLNIDHSLAPQLKPRLDSKKRDEKLTITTAEQLIKITDHDRQIEVVGGFAKCKNDKARIELIRNAIANPDKTIAELQNPTPAVETTKDPEKEGGTPEPVKTDGDANIEGVGTTTVEKSPVKAKKERKTKKTREPVPTVPWVPGSDDGYVTIPVDLHDKVRDLIERYTTNKQKQEEAETEIKQITAVNDTKTIQKGVSDGKSTKKKSGGKRKKTVKNKDIDDEE